MGKIMKTENCDAFAGSQLRQELLMLPCAPWFTLDSNQAGSTNLQTAPFKRNFISYKPQQLSMILIHFWPNALQSKSNWIKWERLLILSRVIRGKEKLNRICGLLVWDLQPKDLGEWRWNHLQNLRIGLRVWKGRKENICLKIEVSDLIPDWFSM